MMSQVKVGSVSIGEGGNPVFVAGPCVIEDAGLVRETAEFLAGLRDRGVRIIMKFSYDKANRTSGNSFRGPGLESGLAVIDNIRREFDLPALVDIHCSTEASRVAEHADCLQIPAFLCRQSSLIGAAGRTGLAVNIKKGQFLSPYSMKYQAEKAIKAGAAGVILTERGTSFGYGDLVVDMRGIVIMKKLGYPVLFDATHSQQTPSGLSEETGGNRDFILPLSRAARIAGADGIFCEVHPRPGEAASDRSTQLDFDGFEELVNEVSKLQS